MYLQCVQILAKFRITKFGIRALQIQNRNEKRREKVWASPSKITGEKESGPFGYLIGGHCVCARMCMYMCVCMCVCTHCMCTCVCAHVCMCICVCDSR